MLVSIQDAMAYSGHKTKAGFRSFVCRINRALPQDKRVIRLGGRVDINSLQEAIAIYSRMDNKMARTTGRRLPKTDNTQVDA